MEVVDVMARISTAGLDRAEVAQAVGTSQRTVARWQAGTVVPRPDLLDRLLELAAVVDHIADAVGERGLRLWLRAPHPGLGYDKPLERIATGGYRDVIAAARVLIAS